MECLQLKKVKLIHRFFRSLQLSSKSILMFIGKKEGRNICGPKILPLIKLIVLLILWLLLLILKIKFGFHKEVFILTKVEAVFFQTQKITIVDKDSGVFLFSQIQKKMNNRFNLLLKKTKELKCPMVRKFQELVKLKRAMEKHNKSRYSLMKKILEYKTQ